MNIFFEPLEYQFLREALVVGAVVGAMCAVLSCFLVLKGWALMGDAVSHAVLPGIVLAHLAGLPLAVGAFAAGLGCTVASGWLKTHSRLKEDTVIGVVFTGLFGFGLVLFSRIETDLHLDHILFGNILGVSRAQVWQTTTIGAAVIALILAKRRDLLLLCFDEKQARVLALPATAFHYLLLSLLAVVIVVSLQAVGLLLVVAMLITPGATARLWTDSFDRMLAVAATTAVGSSFLGILLSYHINGSSSASIVLVQAAVFVLSLIIDRLRSRVRRQSADGNQ
ncbi:MAG: metal ABC transporter permease [Verrucomicrobiales bacterium]